MQDEEFFRLLMDKWKATTWAENAYWSYEEDEHTELCDIRANQEHAIDGIAKGLVPGRCGLDHSRSRLLPRSDALPGAGVEGAGRGGRV